MEAKFEPKNIPTKNLEIFDKIEFFSVICIAYYFHQQSFNHNLILKGGFNQAILSRNVLNSKIS